MFIFIVVLLMLFDKLISPHIFQFLVRQIVDFVTKEI